MTEGYCIRHGGYATGTAAQCLVCVGEQQQRCARGEHVRSGHDATSGWVVSRCVHCGATDGTVAGDVPLCPHGAIQAYCAACNQTNIRMVAERLAPPMPTDDARALLWVSMYLLRQFDCRGHERVNEFACNAADAAVRAFDDRYPKTKG